MIEIVAKHHNEWKRIIKQFGEHFYADDLVQETYLMLMKWSTPDKYITNNEPNRAYIWLCLRNSFLLYQKEKKRFQKLPIEAIQGLSYNENNLQYFEAIEKIDTFIKKEVETWHPYDSAMFRVHIDKKMSGRKISRMSGISPRSVFTTLNKCKERLIFAVGEDYADLINEEFERI